MAPIRSIERSPPAHAHHHRRLLACLLATMVAGGIPAHGLAAAARTSTLQVPPAAGYLTAEGNIRVVGYNDMDEMLPALGAVFEARHPGIRFEWVLKGTRTAPGPLLDGTSAFAPMGAELEDGDLHAWRRAQPMGPLAVAIAHDSLTPGALSSPTGILVHASHPLQRISIAELRRVVAGGEGQSIRWRELGVEGEAGAHRIRVVGLAQDTAIGALMLRRLGVARYATHFDGHRQSRDVAAAVATDPHALGIANLNHAGPGLRALAIVDDEGREIRGDVEGIRSGLYPFDRHLLIYVRRDPQGRVEPVARAFLCLALSPQGQHLIASGRRGYLPLNAGEVEQAQRALGGCP